MGEATNSLLKRNPAFPITAARKIIAHRNRVIHAYDAVDEIIVWNVIVNDMPVLLREVEMMLAEK